MTTRTSPRPESPTYLESFLMAEKKGPSVSVASLPHDDDDWPLTARTNVPTVAPSGWPTEPEKLQPSQLEMIWLCAYDIFLCIVPCLMIAKTTLLIHTDKNDRSANSNRTDYTSSLTKHLIFINEQMVTAFTIIFITVMATLMRRLTLWKAQHGAFVSDLEQMHASISLPSTIKMVVTLGKYNIFSAGLIVVWSFYYLGSQASEREYLYRLSDLPRKFPILYPSAATDWDIGQIPTIKDLNSDFYVYRNVDRASSGVDYKGSMLLPDVHGYRDKGLLRPRNDTELQRWISVDPLDKDKYYRTVSLKGASVHLQASRVSFADTIREDVDQRYMWTSVGDFEVDLRTKVVGTFNLETSYFYVQCGLPEVDSGEEFPTSTAESTTASIKWTDSTITTDDSTRGSQAFEIRSRLQVSPCMHCTRETSEITNTTRVTAKATCNISRPEVEVMAECPTGICIAKKIRHLGSQSPNPFNNITWATGFFDNLLKSAGPRRFETASGVTISDIESVLGIEYISENAYNPSDATGERMSTISQQITTLFNTYYAVIDENAKGDPQQSRSNFNNFSMNGALYTPHYTLIWPWIIIDYVACAVLLAAAVFSFWLRTQTLAPDIFGYVSSLTRDNPYVHVPAGGSKLSGIDRAKHMRDIKIRIADVGHEGKPGRIGVVQMDQAANIEPLSRERPYL